MPIGASAPTEVLWVPESANFYRNLANGGGDPLLPFFGAGVVHRGTGRVHRDCNGHIGDIEFINGFHPQIGKANDPGALDRF